MNTEELELLSDSKYRNYVAAVDKALKNFEYSSEWADLISALGKLNKVFQNNAKYQVIPKKLTIGKRLAQCLHPALPSGVHRKALETYEIIFKIIGPKRLAKDLFLYRTNTLLEKVAAAVEQSAFYSALWGSILTSPAVRLPGITYVLCHLNRKLSMEDQLFIIGSDIELMVEAVSTSVQDSSVLVQRSTLDLILFCFPFHMSQATRPDMIRILSAALHVVLRRDMSLNRRLYAWLLGFDNNGAIIGPRSTRHSNPEEHTIYYFNSFSKDMLVQAMIGILQGKTFGGEDESVVTRDLKPFRILISLLDKPELGPAILEDVLIEVFRTLHLQCKAELDLQIQSPFQRDHTQLSRRTLNTRLQAGPGSSSDTNDLSLAEFCLLVDFLLDIVSLFIPPVEYTSDVFEDNDNPPSSRSSESGFTEFVQYQADKSEDIDRSSGDIHKLHSSLPVGSVSSEAETASTVGSEDTVVHSSPRIGHLSTAISGTAKQKTVMQCCLEYFQQFLTRLISLYVSSCTSTECFRLQKGNGATTVVKDHKTIIAPCTQMAKKDCLRAFTAACQLFLECSSFPVYIAEGNSKSAPPVDEYMHDCEQVQPPLWLQSLMNACCCGSEFSIQAVAISLVMDLVGLAQSVAAETGENGSNLEMGQPMSPSQGRVAVVIRPPLTQGMLRFIAEKTEFFKLIYAFFYKHVALTLWDQMAEGTPQHHQRSVELFYQLHNLVPSSSICEDVISQQLTHRDKKIRLEAHIKFSVLWHLTRDLNVNKSSPFNRTFDRSLFIMLDSLSSCDGSTCSIGQAWLHQVLQRHDIARVLEPLLLLLLHPKTHRVSVQRVQAERHWSRAKSVQEEGGGPNFIAEISYDENFSKVSVGDRKETSAQEANGKGHNLEEVEHFSLTVNPLSDNLSLLSTSSENLQLASADFDLPDQQAEILQSFDSGGSQSSTADNTSFEEHDSTGTPETPESNMDTISHVCLKEDILEDVVQQVLSDIVDQVEKTVEEGLALTEEWQQVDSDSSKSECSLFEPSKNGCSDLNKDVNVTIKEPSTESELNGMHEFFTSSSESNEKVEEGITRHSSSPSIVMGSKPVPELGLHADEHESRKRSHSSLQLSLKGKIMEKLSDKSPGAKPKLKTHKKKDEDKKKLQSEKAKQPSIFFGDSLDLENWYSCGEGEVSEIESDIGSPGVIRTASPIRFNIHPLYQHVLLYLQLYDSSRTLHSLSALAAMLKANPSGFVNTIATTSINNTYTPQLSLLQNLLARHRISVMGKDFYSHIPVDSHNHAFRSSMFIEIIISLCLYFLRSYYPTHVPCSQQDLSGNRNMQIMSIEVLTLLFTELTKVTESSAKGFASFISDVLSKCKVQKVVLHCILSTIFSAQKWHGERAINKNIATMEEGLSEDSIINFSEDEIDNCSTLQSQLLRLLQSLIILEHRVIVLPEEIDSGYEFVAADAEHINPQQPMTSLQYLHSQPITSQGMFLCAVIRALHQHYTCKMHPQWINLITATLPYMRKVLKRIVTSVTLQLCRNLENLIQHYRYEMGLADNRPVWMASSVPPDMILTVLEGITTIIHYCLLDPSTQYHQQLLVNVDQKHLAEARSGILSILHTIISSVTLLWSVLYLADTSERPASASAILPSIINLGSTKNLRQQILELLGPISMNHGVHFMAAIAYVWNERKHGKNSSRNKVIPTASEEQLLLVELVRSISAMRTETVIQTVKEVLKQPPAIAKEKKHLSLEVCMLQFFYAYVQRVLNEFILKNPNLENKKDQRDLQDVTHKVVEAIGNIAGSSLEQTTWLRRNLEVKASPQIVVDGSSLETDVEDLMLTVAEASSFTPSVYSVHALTLLAEVLAHLLDMVFYSDEKERVIPLLVNIMHYVVPYLRNHSAHNAPSYRACVQLLSSLSGYQYTRRAWKKEAFDLFMDTTFFQMDSSCVSHWRAIMDHLMTHDKTTFRDLMTRVAVAQSSSLNLFTNREAELEQRAMLLKRLAFAIFSSEVDQYQKYLPDIQERLVESLRLPQVPTLHAQVFLFFRVLLLRVSPQHLTSLWPTMITELVQVFLLMEQELTADEDISRTSGPSAAGLETTYTGGNGFSTSYNSQRWLNLYLSACKFLDLALALPSESLPQFQMYRWAFIPEVSDDSGLEVRRQGMHQREFKPYVVRLAKLLRKRTKKNLEDDSSGKSLSWEPGHLLLTLYTIRSMEQLLPFFSLLSQVFNSKVTSRSAGHSESPVLYTQKDVKSDSQKLVWSKARQKIEEMLEKDFLEGVIKL
ncbi:DOP1 protein, partial [Polypterus senegalus]